MNNIIMFIVLVDLVIMQVMFFIAVGLLLTELLEMIKNGKL